MRLVVPGTTGAGEECVLILSQKLIPATTGKSCPSFNGASQAHGEKYPLFMTWNDMRGRTFPRPFLTF